VKLAVSHLAWTPEEDAEAHALLRELGVSQIEIAPARFWSKWASASQDSLRFAIARVADAGMSVVAFQALLFGRPDLTLFESDEARENCAKFCEGLAALAGISGARALVFGSPKNRIIPEAMRQEEAWRIAREFFRRIGAAAAARSVCFCLEPNPAEYGGNFLTHMEGTVSLIREIESAGVCLQVDAGELAMNAEDVERVIADNSHLIGHVHISQPLLGDFSQPWEGHARLAKSLRASGYADTISIEMKRADRGLDAVREAIKFARACYGAE
jgi:D-psicose/D-tagatose/L-ribulose 3-epimerase